MSKVYGGKPLMITIDDPRSPVSEAYRTLRTNIYFAGVDKPIKKILIAGANPNCGKSTTAANLGVTIAQTGAKVLLIDTDLRKPVLHNFFEQVREPGLSNIIVDNQRKPEEVIQRTDSGNLFLLPSGPLPPYPAEMLASERMKYLVEYLSEQYEFLIFDSPPVIAVADASILAGLTDGTVLVLDYGRVTRDEAVIATEQLRRVNANIIGTILNAIPQSNGYYNYYQYYDSGELGEGGKKRKKGHHS